MLSIPEIVLEGTPFERGMAHGQALKDKIREFAHSVIDVHRENNTCLAITRKALQTFCLRQTGFLEKFSPDLFQEIKGIAKGADLPFEDILMLNSVLELEDLRAPELGGKSLPDTLWGCTSFNIPAQAGKDKVPYIGQTYDMEKYYQKYLTLMRIKEPDSPRMLVITLAGIVGLNGMNSAGIAAVINKIVARDARPGVIYPFIMREALGQSRIGDALGKAIFSPRASGLNYQFSGQGITFCAETSATRYELLDCKGGLAHTNHYVGQKMGRFETPNWLSHGGSMVRKQVADLFLERHRGRISPELLRELTCNHTNAPRSICAHGFPQEGENTAFHTIFAVIMSPEQGWMEICPGNPCENEYVRYAV